MDFVFRRLESGDDTKDFDCGKPQLNEYLSKYARQDQRRMFGVTYVAVCESKVIGYFTLATTAIPRDGLPEDMLRGIPKYNGLPAFLLGRLAVDKKCQGRQIGEHLLSKCFDYCLFIAKWTGARYVIADVENSAISWYERFGFRRIEGGRDTAWTKMLIDLEVVRTAIDHRAKSPVH